MKSNKKFIIGMLFGILLTGTVSVVAVKMTAKEIGFKSTDENWQVDNVEDAMNELYEFGKNALSIIKLGNYTNDFNGVYDGISGENLTIDLSSYEGFENFSSDNFILEAVDGICGIWVSNDTHQQSMNFTISKMYDADTGILTISNTYTNHLGGIRLSAGLIEYNVYLVY